MLTSIKFAKKTRLTLNNLSSIAQELSSFNLVMLSSQEKTVISTHEGNIPFIKILGILQMKKTKCIMVFHQKMSFL